MINAELIKQEKINWCISQHRNTNHFYDTYLPYEFHLRMVVQVANDFKHLCPVFGDKIELACWGHDLIEDCRVSWNDCKKELCDRIANVQYSLLTKSRMTEMYKKENAHFVAQIDTGAYLPMIEYLNSLFKN